MASVIKYANGIQNIDIGDLEFINLTNAYGAPDGDWASADWMGMGLGANYLEINFEDFTEIPSGSTITGLKCEIYNKCDNDNTTVLSTFRFNFSGYSSGTNFGTEYSPPQYDFLTTTEGWHGFGGDGNLMGHTNPQVSWLNSASLILITTDYDTQEKAYIGSIKLTVYYTEPRRRIIIT